MSSIQTPDLLGYQKIEKSSDILNKACYKRPAVLQKSSSSYVLSSAQLPFPTVYTYRGRLIFISSLRQSLALDVKTGEKLKVISKTIQHSENDGKFNFHC